METAFLAIVCDLRSKIVSDHMVTSLSKAGYHMISLRLSDDLSDDLSSLSMISVRPSKVPSFSKAGYHMIAEARVTTAAEIF